MVDPIILYICILAAAIFGYLFQSLTLSGALGAFIVGLLVIIGFQFNGLLLLAVFFLTSSFWSIFKKDKKHKAMETNEKGSRRDFSQVLANGGVAALAALLYYVTENSMFLFAFIIAIAAANADTWASEIGTLSKREPFAIKTLRRAPKGTSGAVSLLGSVASCLGSFTICAISWLLYEEISLATAALLFIFGCFGSIIDTLLGATVQVTYRCEQCQLLTEKTQHCDSKTVYKSGIRWVNNEVVNAASILLAALIGMIAIV